MGQDERVTARIAKEQMDISFTGSSSRPILNLCSPMTLLQNDQERMRSCSEKREEAVSGTTK